MSILIVLSILSVFGLSLYYGTTRDLEGFMGIGTIGLLFTCLFGGIYTCNHVSNIETVPVEATMVKTPHKVYVDWVNYEGDERFTEYNKHKEYTEIGICSEWKATISTNDWGYSWSDSDDIFYINN